MVEADIGSVVEEMCAGCSVKDTVKTVVSVVKDLAVRTFVWYLSSLRDGYVASIYSIYLLFTEHVIFDAASLVLCISSIEPRWLEAFSILSSAFMMHVIVKREFSPVSKPTGRKIEVRSSTYEKIRSIVRENVLRLSSGLGNVSGVDCIVAPLSSMLLLLLTYLCSAESSEDPVQHVIESLRYVLNEDTFKIVSEYGNTTPELMM
ncbi:MAG: hypothetical protein GXO23_04310 [Crenarchaeota archaeon]|nr:hypothetical protein [Thermoproteota archaeon]